MEASKTQAKRRSNGQGTIYQQANGSWRGQCKTGYTSEGKPRRISVTGKTRTEVSRKIAAIVASTADGEHLVRHEDLTLGAYAGFWLNHESVWKSASAPSPGIKICWTHTSRRH